METEPVDFTSADEAYKGGRVMGSYCTSELAEPLYKSFALGFRDGVRKPGVLWKNVIIIILALIALAEFVFIIH